MAGARPIKWDDPDGVLDVSRVDEDDAVNTAERIRARLEVWNPDTLTWDRMTQPDGGGGGGGGGAVTVADGADVALGARADAAWSSGSGTVIAILKAVHAMLDALQIDTASLIALAEEAQDYTSRLDDAGGGVTYVGKAPAGATPASASWQVKRLTESAGDLTIEFADGNSSFDNVWNDRATLSYS